MKYQLSILLVFIIAISKAQEVIENDWLRNNLYEMKSIDQKNDDFDDLSFLVPILEGKNIVLLGEEEHSFATTFEAKSRLIKFLNQKLGFTVLAFEYNLYSMSRINQIKPEKSSKLLPIQQYIYPFWGQTTSTNELFRFVEKSKSSENKLNYIGFDVQITSQFDFFKDLESLLKQNKSEILVYRNFEKFKEVFIKSYSKGMENINLEDYALMTMFIDDIIFDLELKEDRSENILTTIQILINIKQEMLNKIVGKPTADFQAGNLNPTNSIYGFLGDQRSMGIYNRRDKQMAENILWIKNELYRNQKIIIWGHSEHTMYNRNQVRKKFPPEFPYHIRFSYGYNFKNTAMYLKEEIGDELYSIGFSTINGQIDYSKNKRVQYLSEIAISPNSIEEVIAASDFEYPFLNFNNTKEFPPEKYFHSEMISNILGGTETFGNISEFFDGILFIRNASPIKYILTD